MTKFLFYIVDPTQGNKTFTYNTASEVIRFLEQLCVRKFGMARDKFIIDQSDYIGYAENNDATFYDLMVQHGIQMGVVRDGRMVPTNILQTIYNEKYRDELGD